MLVIYCESGIWIWLMIVFPVQSHLRSLTHSHIVNVNVADYCGIGYCRTLTFIDIFFFRKPICSLRSWHSKTIGSRRVATVGKSATRRIRVIILWSRLVREDKRGHGERAEDGLSYSSTCAHPSFGEEKKGKQQSGCFKYMFFSYFPPGGGG